MASKPSPNSHPKRELALLLIREARWHRQVEGRWRQRKRLGLARAARARAGAEHHDGEGNDGDREDGAVHHGHLGHEEHRLDERDDQGPSVPAPRALGELSATGRAGLGEQCTPLRKEPVAK